MLGRGGGVKKERVNPLYSYGHENLWTMVF